MRIFVLPALACAFVVSGLLGCAADPKAALVGNYQADASTLKLPASLAPFAEKAKAAVGSTTLKLNSDNTFVLGGGPQSTSGKWKFDEKNVILMPTTGETANLLIGPNKKSLEISRDMAGGKMILTLTKTG